ncbi:MAG TPA: helix-turn-helix domain-containing protein [Acidimicrobiales bacterium]|nr:helix-turn-helix domain-containing protein [Acidimicrobiales bacterium]
MAETVHDIRDALADAALRCIARWGLTKTALEDVAREAGSSRATLYRAFPGGGKDALFSALADRELARLEAAARATVDRASDLEDAVVGAIGSIARHLEDHAAFQFLLAHEPGLVLPHLAFHHLDALLGRVRDVGGPMFERFLAPADAAALAESVARIVISHTCCPSVGVRLTDDSSVRRLVRAFVLPGLLIPI